MLLTLLVWAILVYFGVLLWKGGFKQLPITQGMHKQLPQNFANI